MSNVVRFPPKKETQPDPDCVLVMASEGKPQTWLKFLCSFDCDGDQYSFEIWALDFQDAERRLAALRTTARLDGQVYSESEA